MGEHPEHVQEGGVARMRREQLTIECLRFRQPPVPVMGEGDGEDFLVGHGRSMHRLGHLVRYAVSQAFPMPPAA